ncbi:MAG: patatin-like phospholipase family protein [Crocosphaera sp.]|nr:patatin-like phospholipase family protein [Crocosphaera sp.]
MTEQTSTTELSQNNQEIDFGNIALCFSGGGYRATAFHLGVLIFLEQVGLREQVTMLSTVSGGTITGAKYALSLSRKESFEQFHDDLYQFLLNERLPNEWLKELPNMREGQEFPSLIVAAAETYNNKLLDHGTFQEIIDNKEQIHLKEIVFNTTELNQGNNFRFRVGESGLIGNKNIQLKPSVLAEIRLADVVAASSCFPIGFKPFNFPKEFQWTKKSWETLLSEEITAPKTKEFFQEGNSLYLVDGGIYDNLGIESIWLADARKNNNNLKTLIISDTDNIGQEETLLKDAKLKLPDGLGNITASQIYNNIQENYNNIQKLVNCIKKFVPLIPIFFRTSFIITTAFIFYLLFCFGGMTVGIKHTITEILLFILLSLIFGSITYVLWQLEISLNFITGVIESIVKQNNFSENFLKNQLKKVIQNLENIVSDWSLLLKTLGNLKLNELLQSLEIRLSSIPALFLAFLKGQRRRNYNKTREISEEVFKKQYIANYIFDMAKDKNLNNNSNENLLQLPKISAKATNTPTTLWFDSNPEKAKEELDNLILCGQVTMCYNLRKFINKVEKSDAKLSAQAQEINQKVNEYWEHLKRNGVA